MKKNLFLLPFLLLLLVAVQSMGQGTLRGKISDKNGETLIGATVVLKLNPGIGVTADLDGNYSLKINDSTPQIIVISFVSYKTIEFPVTLKNNQIIVKNFVMESASFEVEAVDITAKAIKANDYYMEEVKKKSATTIDYVSSATMKKTGDGTVTAAVTRVAGVSTNGQFITVRGIGDRYVKTSVNGSKIPTLDPFTNNIKLDLFPPALVDNVIITKTASPDLPGDWAGAYLSIETKDYPDQLAVSVETAFGYNSQSTFKNVISSERSKTDWMGYDNSFRDYDHASFVNANATPTQFQQLEALGLGSYYSSLGVNNENWYTNAEEYYKLGLVQLGLLAPAQFDDPQAIQHAKNDYLLQGYNAQAFATINKDVPASGKAFPNNWNTETRKAPLDFSQNFTIGNQVSLFGKPLGFITGFRYYSANVYDPESIANRAGVASDSTGGLVPVVTSQLKQQSGIETNGWNALFNAAYKFTPNNSISVLFMPNLNGTNRVRKSYDKTDKTTVVTLNQYYEQRKQLVYQLKSENYIPSVKTKLDANFSYTRGSSSAPDFKNLQYWINPDSSLQIGGSIGDGIHRYFRYLDENVFDSRIVAEVPIDNEPIYVRKIRFGGSYQHTDQTYDQYDYYVLTGPNIGPLPNEDINAFLSLDQFEIKNETDPGGIPVSYMNAYYQEIGTDANHTFGNSYVAAAFAMADYGITTALRVSGGLRIEKAHVFTDVVAFDKKGYQKNDPRRVYSDAYPIANPGVLDKTSILPSINIIYALKEDEYSPINIRANYSQSVARPSIRELSDVAVLDYELRAPVYGNSSLKPVTINNYDFRGEAYFKSGNNITASLFYKDFKNHIELINANGYTWQNVDKSNVMGVELEGNLAITKNLNFGSNITLVKSQTTFTRTRYDLAGGIPQYIPLDTVTRSMYGQAPFAVNAILSYKLDSLGLIFTVAYNVQGPRLVIASNNKEVPDVYELPRNLIDLKVSKSISKHFSLSVTVRNILNQSVTRSYKYDEGYDKLDYDRYTYGTNYQLTFGYKL